MSTQIYNLVKGRQSSFQASFQASHLAVNWLLFDLQTALLDDCDNFAESNGAVFVLQKMREEQSEFYD